MAETVYVLCDNGSVMPHDLPLPSGIAARVGSGQLKLVNADGSPLAEQPEPDAFAAAATEADGLTAAVEALATGEPPSEADLAAEAAVDAAAEEPAKKTTRAKAN